MFIQNMFLSNFSGSWGENMSKKAKKTKLSKVWRYWHGWQGWKALVGWKTLTGEDIPLKLLRKAEEKASTVFILCGMGKMWSFFCVKVFCWGLLIWITVKDHDQVTRVLIKLFPNLAWVAQTEIVSQTSTKPSCWLIHVICPRETLFL